MTVRERQLQTTQTACGTYLNWGSVTRSGQILVLGPRLVYETDSDYNGRTIIMMIKVNYIPVGNPDNDRTASMQVLPYFNLFTTEVVSRVSRLGIIGLRPI